MNTDTMPTAFVVLRYIIGFISVILFFPFMQKAKVKNGRSYAILALFLAPFVGLLSLLVMLIMISRVNQAVFKPRGIKIGLLDPKF
ncbi:hypothetical protein [Deinococcus hopiensis]|uniref:Uncharacterized protein n=1 Tax=Deinococcus hopiensis KR-140 TaxID=695939 RepID=A0A1W1UM13_9DEIO|nr:hypothetical protein [Deinococcus hopiensis]SMB81764.1 hypothetical protein SAMN00790413_04711 [Deinococcus hopiensis KR-140]